MCIIIFSIFNHLCLLKCREIILISSFINISYRHCMADRIASVCTMLGTFYTQKKQITRSCPILNLKDERLDFDELVDGFYAVINCWVFFFFLVNNKKLLLMKKIDFQTEWLHITCWWDNKAEAFIWFGHNSLVSNSIFFCKDKE